MAAGQSMVGQENDWGVHQRPQTTRNTRQLRQVGQVFYDIMMRNEEIADITRNHEAIHMSDFRGF